MDQLSMAGINPGQQVQSDLSQMDPTTMANLLLGSEADLFGNRMALSGLGHGAGTTLAELGQRTGAGISGLESNADMIGRQAAQQGTSNAIGAAALASAAYFSDEILLLRSGRIVQRGTITDLLESPKDPFVTQFIMAQRTTLAGDAP